MMVYNQSDSDGTDDDDLPPQRVQTVRKGRPSGNGKTSVYIDQLIHQLELDAYTALLRAFSAQSEAITWTKEGLMSDMRKELRVADEQHREILGKVGQDAILKRIRNYRQTGEDHGMPDLSHDPSPSPAVSNSRKKQKLGHAAQPLPPPLPSALKPAPPLSAPLPSPALSGPAFLRGKKSRSKGVAIAPIVPTRGAPPAGATGITPGRGGAGSGRGAPWSNHKGAGPSTDTRVDPWIGRRVMTRWPEDGTFYEAVVADYNKEDMMYMLAYGYGTKEETWEWVDLKALPKEDVRWLDGPPVILDGKLPTVVPAPAGRGLGRGMKRGRGGFGGAVGRPKGSGNPRGRPAFSHDKAAAAAAAVPVSTPQPRPWRAAGSGEAPDRNGTDKKVARPQEIQVPDVSAYWKEADELEHEEDLEKLESARRMAKEHEEMLQKALVQVGESSDDDEAASDDDDRNHGTESPVHSVGLLEKARHNTQPEAGNQHVDSEDENDMGEDRREDGSEANHGAPDREGAVSDTELDNADDEGEGDDDR